MKDYIGYFNYKDCKNNNYLYQAKSFSCRGKYGFTAIRGVLLIYRLIEDDISEVKENGKWIIAAVIIIQAEAKRP